ncbi:MAG: branched-chain amino acid ABC transporter substrate-binding protein [Ardenticatenales bacterium]|nr:branched-chain amino acid ABC transporter substrate-binding protein [Ardenticatenales bacterium]
MRKLLLVLLLVMSLALVACGGTTTPTTGGEATAVTGGEATAEPEVEATAEGGETEATGECTDELGCVDIAAGDSIRLAYMMVVAGPDQSLGIDSRRGVELAIADRGEEGVLGHEIELVGEDTACNAEGGQTAATKIAADKSVVAVVGTSCSSEARAAAPIISDAGLTMVSSSNTAPDLTDPEKHAAGYLRTAHNDKVQGRVAAEFVYNELGLTKVATVHDGSPYAEGLVGAFEENFTALGGEITAHEAVGPDDTDMRPVLTRIATGSPEMLYFPVFTKAGGFIATQSNEVAGLEEVALMGADGLYSPDFINAASSAAEGMYLSSPDFSAFGTAYSDTFLPAHEAEYGEAPISAFHAHAYDAANMIFAAIEAVAVETEDGGLRIGRQALRDALFATSGFQGLTGNITCDEYGDCADPFIAVYEITADDISGSVVPTTKVYPTE